MGLGAGLVIGQFPDGQTLMKPTKHDGWDEKLS